MILTIDHLRFYQAKKTPVPTWFSQIAKPPKWAKFEPCAVSVHALINVQVPEYKRTKTEPHNLIHLIRLVQTHKEETVPEFLSRLVTRPYTTDSKRRIGYARKWLKKLKSH